MKLVAAALIVAAGCTSAGGAGDDVVPPPDEPQTLVTPVGVPTGDPTSASIGPEGGTVATADGAMTVDIPAGALAAPTTITIQPITTHIPGPIGSAVRLGPEGQTFAAPVTLTFHYDEAELGGNDPGSLMVAFQTATGSWSHVPTAASDPVAHTISVHSVHFSDWTTGTWINLDPLYSYVAVNNTKQLQVKFCLDKDPACPVEPEPGVLDVHCDLVCEYITGGDWEWAVNGVVGGDAEHGMIDGTFEEEGVGAFFAPATVPSPEDVQVSASCGGDCTPRGRLIAFGRIWIDTTQPYVGRVWSTRIARPDETFKITADVRWVYNEAELGYEVSTGSVDVTYVYNVGTCVINAEYHGGLSAADGHWGFLDGNHYTGTGLVANTTTYTGTTTCTSTGAPEPISFPALVQWWLPPPAPLAGWEKWTDGTLEESQPLEGGGSVTWSFTPNY